MWDTIFEKLIGGIVMDGNNYSSHTEKEVLLLKDQLEAEALTIRKLMDYQAELNDPSISKMVDGMIQKHRDHYNRILSHIK